MSDQPSYAELQQRIRILEAEIAKCRKAESLERMVGAVAHRYNNLMQTSIGNLELALTEIPGGSSLQIKIINAIEASRHASQVSHLMLAYLGQNISNKTALNLSDVCRDAMRSFVDKLSKKTHLRSELPFFGPIIDGDRVQFKQMISNLLVNSIEALGDSGGDVIVKIEEVKGSDILGSRFYPAEWQPAKGDYVCISISDNGCGISPDSMDNIFDPFSSNKFTGRGLGLPVVLGIVKSHGGAIAVDTISGKGSTFRVFLPFSAQGELPVHDEQKAESGAMGSTGLILVVDDEPGVLDVAENLLKMMGYEVITAENGATAIKLLHEHKERIECVLCDVAMPQMDGWETLAALRDIEPQVPVILASGFHEAHVMKVSHKESPQAFLQKPYTVDELKQALANVHRKDKV